MFPFRMILKGHVVGDYPVRFLTYEAFKDATEFCDKWRLDYEVEGAKTEEVFLSPEQAVSGMRCYYDIPEYLGEPEWSEDKEKT